jgi:hypothetical protein
MNNRRSNGSADFLRKDVERRISGAERVEGRYTFGEIGVMRKGLPDEELDYGRGDARGGCLYPCVSVSFLDGLNSYFVY